MHQTQATIQNEKFKMLFYNSTPKFAKIGAPPRAAESTGVLYSYCLQLPGKYESLNSSQFSFWKNKSTFKFLDKLGRDIYSVFANKAFETRMNLKPNILLSLRPSYSFFVSHFHCQTIAYYIFREYLQMVTRQTYFKRHFSFVRVVQ